VISGNHIQPQPYEWNARTMSMPRIPRNVRFLAFLIAQAVTSLLALCTAVLSIFWLGA
jgi:hypothetical protein